MILIWSLLLYSLYGMEIKEVENGLLKVDWSTVDQSEIKKNRSRSSAFERAIKDVDMPIYIPKRYLHSKDLIVVADSGFCIITIPIKGASVMVSVDRTFQKQIVSGGEDMKKLMKSQLSKFVRSEGIMSVDFSKHGINYSMSVECDKPNGDKRCTRESFLRGLYSELVVVGGKR